MKMKSILAAIASIAIVASTFSSVVFAAGSYGTPEFTASVQYPVEMYGSEYLAVTIGYKGFSGFSAYNSFAKAGTGLTAMDVKLGYDTSALTYVTTLDGDFSEGTAGISAPSMAYGWTYANLKSKTETSNFMTAYFSVNSGVDFNSQQIEFTFDAYSAEVTKVTGGVGTPEIYGKANGAVDDIIAESFTYGTTSSEGDDDEFSAETSDLEPYHVGAADGAEVKRIGCTLTNRTAEELNVKFTNKADATDFREFVVGYPQIGGEAKNYFEAWIFNAPAQGVALEVTEVVAQ